VTDPPHRDPEETRPDRVLLLDNYDSFVGNLYQYLGELGAEPVIRRNDAISVEEAESGGFTHLLVSPGPKTPAHAGVSVELIRRLEGRIPILGVCLGHQAIGAAFGGRVVPAKRLLHGKTSVVRSTGAGVLRGLPERFTATRYHSLALERESLPAALEVTAETGDGEIMAVRRRGGDAPVEGVQFHPESILSEHGHDLLANFLGYRPSALWAGEGLFETVLVRDGGPGYLADHLERLARSATARGIVPDRDAGEVAAECRERCRGRALARLRILLDRGRISVEVADHEDLPREAREAGVAVRLAPSPGHPLGAAAGHKVLPYSPLLRARAAARAEGAFDTVFTAPDGALLEGSACNLFAVIDGEVLTPPLSRGILPGVVRARIPAREADLFPADLARASEVFLTGSLMEVVPVARIGDLRLRPGPVARGMLALVRRG